MLSQEKIDALKQSSQHEDAEVRFAAVQALLHDHLICGEDDGDADWELLAHWVLDPNEEIRDSTMLFLGVHSFDDEGVQWLIPLLSEALARHASGQAGILLWSLASENDRRFELTWRAVSELLDRVDNEKMVSVLTCGYVEDVLVWLKPGADDPRIRKWTEGDSQLKKMVLLDVAHWLGVEQDNIREVVERLALDQDPEVSKYAKEIRSREP